MDRITNEHVRKTIIKHMGLYEDLLATVKRRILKWYGHLTRSDGQTKVILQGTVEGQRLRGMPKKRWIDNIAERTGKSFAETSSHGTHRVERVDGEVHYDTRSYGTNAEDRQISGIRCMVCYQAEQYSNTRVH